MIVHSFGGGVQSVAILVLVCEGKLPRPDWVVMADTGREATATWEYLNSHAQPYAAKYGLTVHIASHSLSKVDLYSHKGEPLMPLYTADGGVLRTFCSVEWKRRVVERFLRQHGVRGGTRWIGFSLDERKRATLAPEPNWIIQYPLLDLMLTRSDCEMLVQRAGLPKPPKSSCYMCPYRSNQQWRELRDNYPEDFRRAIEIDEEMRHSAPLDGNRDGRLYVHFSRVPLAQADLESDTVGASRQCGLGLCFL